MAELEFSISIDDTEALKKLLGTFSTGPIVDFGMEEAAGRMRIQVQRGTPVYKKHAFFPLDEPEGTLKRTWTQPERAGSQLYTFQAGRDYATILEEGTFPEEQLVETRADGEPGRLTRFGKGIYSKQAKGGIVGPVMKDDSKLQNILEYVASRIVTEMQKQL